MNFQLYVFDFPQCGFHICLNGKRGGGLNNACKNTIFLRKISDVNVHDYINNNLETGIS